MKNTIIKFNNVGKKFKKGSKLLLKEALLDLFRPNPTEWFWALKDVSFEVEKGETLGIIGPNGSGKSTILKLVSGVMFPSRGEVSVAGKVSPLIELGAGFHPELTGRENVYLNGVILGLTRKQVKERFEKIVEFAEIQDFIDTPVKHYSSGMYMRLGFSIAIHANPDILLVDELLAVGDINFQKKCMDKMNEFKTKGITIILISHNLKTIEDFCERTIYLDKGKLVSDGKSKDVIKDFTSLKEFRYGDRGVEILKTWVKSTEEYSFDINMRVKFNQDVKNPVFGITLRNKKNEEVFAANTLWNKVKTGDFKKNSQRTISFLVTADLQKGDYAVTPAIAPSDLSGNYDWISNAVIFSVKSMNPNPSQTTRIEIK